MSSLFFFFAKLTAPSLFPVMLFAPRGFGKAKRSYGNLQLWNTHNFWTAQWECCIQNKPKRGRTTSFAA